MFMCLKCIQMSFWPKQIMKPKTWRRNLFSRQGFPIFAMELDTIRAQNGDCTLCTAQTQVRVPVATAQVTGETSWCRASVERLLVQHSKWLNSSSTSTTCDVSRTEGTRFTGWGDRSSVETWEGTQSPLCTLGDNSSEQCHLSSFYSWLWFKEIYFRVGVWNLFFSGSCLLVLKS